MENDNRKSDIIQLPHSTGRSSRNTSRRKSVEINLENTSIEERRVPTKKNSKRDIEARKKAKTKRETLARKEEQAKQEALARKKAIARKKAKKHKQNSTPVERHIRLSDFKNMKKAAEESDEGRRQKAARLEEIESRVNRKKSVEVKSSLDESIKVKRKKKKKEKRGPRTIIPGIYDGADVEEVEKRHRMIHYVTSIYLMIVVIAIIVVFTSFSIEDIQVTGNEHYTNDEIVKIVTSSGNGYIDNSLLLYVKNKFEPIEDVPFIDKMDISYNSRHVITIEVYEKAMAGCVQYMNQYVYFDKDGIVLETSDKKIEDVPCIEGMTFKSMTLHQKLPIKDSDRFEKILKITQLLDKYQLNITGVEFTENGEILLYEEDIKIELGKGDNVEEQFVDLGNILSKLEGRKGTLDMSDFTTENGKATFKLE